MRELRILHCRQSDHIWGPERQIAELARHLPAHGMAMELIMLRRWGLDAEPHPLTTAVRAAGGQAFELSARPQDIPGVVAFLRQRLHHNDLIHTHDFKADLLTIIARRLAPTPWLATDHHLAVDDDPLLRLFGHVDRWALTRANAVVTPSQAQARRLAASIPGDRIHIIPHGIDAAAFAQAAGERRNEARNRHGVTDSQPLVALFGRLEPVKGHSDFLQAAKLLLQTRPDIHFWIVGDGRLAPTLPRQAEQLGIAHAVSFLGYQRDVAPLMAASDLIVLPSYHESFGMVLIEALALAKPVIASAVGGIPEVIQDGAHGYLASPGHPEQLCELILHALAHPQQAAQLGLAGSERVREVFSIEVMIERMAALYLQVWQQAVGDHPRLRVERYPTLSPLP